MHWRNLKSTGLQLITVRRAACRLALGIATLAVLASSLFAQAPAPRIGSEFIPTDATATVVLSIADTMASPVVELYPVEVADAWCNENIGFPASSIDRIKVVVGVPGPGGPMMAVVATLRADADVTAINPEMVNTQEPIDVDGHSCYMIAGAPDVVLHAKDPRTLIVATPNYLDTVLRSADASTASGPLAKMAGSVPHTGNLTALLAVEPIRPMITGLLQSQIDQIPPPLVEFTKTPELLDALLFRLDLADQANGLNLIMLARDDASGEELMGLIQRGLEMGRQIGLSQAMNEIEGEDAVAQATRQYVQRLSDKIVSSLTPKREGRRLTLSGSASQGFATQGVLVGLLLPAVQAAREAARRMTSSNNLKMIGLAMHNYHDAYAKLPTDILGEDGTPLLSWRVAILPFIEQQELYQQFHLDEAWDSPHNITLLPQMPDVYLHPTLPTYAGTTVYQRPISEGSMMHPSEPIKFRDVTDGLSDTIMAVETLADSAVEWTKPSDITIDTDEVMRDLDDGTREGFNVLLGDGAVTYFLQLDPQAFSAMLTRAGGEPTFVP